MDAVMIVSFIDELSKIAAGNFADPQKPAVGGMGGNIMAKPLPSPGFGRKNLKPGVAAPTNYSMMNTQPPMAAANAGAESKAVPPPPVTA